MRYTEQLIEEVRRQSDIVEIIGEAVRLKKQGRSFVGLCPFHPDRNPSMHVNSDIGLFKCFACGKGGNVITFMIEYHRLNFQEAIKSLADRAHISLPDDIESSDQIEKRNRHEAAFRALESAASHYKQQLNLPSGKIAKKYFANRQFDDKLIDEFSLGYSPDAWNLLSSFLLKQGFSEQTLEDAGLIIRREDDKFYDRFRGRAMFSVQDAVGRIVGFGARILNDAKDQPKYINSPQSLLYDKSRILYGLFQAKQQIRSDGFAILVEGYADALTLHQSGFKNTIASSGTALTKEQLQLLSRYCKHLLIVYDADAAGIKAAFRAIEHSVEEGFDVRLVRLPINEDPDSFLRKSGADAFRTRLHDAQTFLEFMISALRDEGGFASPHEQAESLRKLISVIAKVPDVLQHDALMLKIADTLHLSTRDLHRIYDELNKARREIYRRSEENPRNAISQSSDSNNNKSEVTKTDAVAEKEIQPMSIEEREVFRIALTVNNALQFLFEKVNLQPDAMLTEQGRKMFELCRLALSHVDSNPVNWLINEANISEVDSNAIAGLVMNRESPSEKWSNYDVEIPVENARRVMTDALSMLRLRKVENQLANAKISLRSKMAENDEKEILTMVKQLTEERSQLIQSLEITKRAACNQ